MNILFAILGFFIGNFLGRFIWDRVIKERARERGTPVTPGEISFVRIAAIMSGILFALIGYSL